MEDRDMICMLITVLTFHTRIDATGNINLAKIRISSDEQLTQT